MRALVIGGTGFIGTNLVDALLAAGATVRVTRRKKTATILLAKRPVEWIDGSLQEPEKLRRAMDGCDVVYLAGAYYPRYSLDLEGSLAEGVEGVANACSAAIAADVKRFIYTSTIATLGRAPDGRKADERDIPDRMPENSVYRAVKWAMEREVDAARNRGLPAITIIPGGCIGPGDVRVGTGSVVVGVVRGLLTWWVDGTVNLVDVGDVVGAHLLAAASARSDRYCVGGHDVRVGWLLQHIALRYGGRVPELELSADEARERAEQEEREAAPRRQRVTIPRELVDMATTGQPVSSERASAELGLTLGPLDDALDRAHEWFVRHKYIPPREQQRRSDGSA